MPTARIVEAFDELEDGIARLGLRLEAAASQQLAFQRDLGLALGPRARRLR
jgi:hypothetical protein